MNIPQQVTSKALAFVFICLTFSLLLQRTQAATFNIPDGDVAGLIAAIKAANSNPGADTINLAAGGTYTLTAPIQFTNVFGGADVAGLPRITSQITINGYGATIQRSSAAGIPDFRMITTLNADLTLDHVTLKGGRGGYGAAVDKNQGILRLISSTITDNDGGSGGEGTIFNFCGTLTVVNSTISHNRSFGGFGGGGILNFSSFCVATTTVVNSTIFENRADGPSGSQGRGDAIADAFSPPGSVVVKNSILASPSQGLGNDCYPNSPTSLGHNITSDNSCGLTGSGDLVIADLLLGPLSQNGGPTPTHALLTGSPAIDAVPLADCTDAAGAPILTDQRGVARPQSAFCDIGAYELMPSGGPTIYDSRDTFTAGLCSTATTRTIDFTKNDDGTFITDPAADKYFETLTLSGVTFRNVRSYWNGSIYNFPKAVITVDLPPNTFSFGTDLSPFYGTAGTYTITLSTGQTYRIAAKLVPWTWDFFGAVSNTPIEWVTFTYDNDYFILDNFTVGTGCDSTPPTIIVPADSSASADDSCQAAVPDYIAGSTAADDGGSVTLSQSPVAGTLVGLGPHTVTVTAVDGSGNSSSDTVVFTVNDDTPPTLTTTPGNIVTHTDAGLCSAVVTFNLPAATDNCSTATVASSPASGSVFSTGTTTVTVTAIDAAGNTASHSFTVTVTDQENPIITCPANISVMDNVPGSCGASVTLGTPVTSDNCGIASVIGTRSDGGSLTALYPVGATTINWVVTDASGNTASCLQTITVTNPSPVVSITGPPSGSLYAVNTPVNFTGSFTDNAGDTHSAVWTFDGTPQAGIVNEATRTVSASHTFDAAGVYLVTLTVTDDCGQTGTTNQVGGFDALVVIYDPDAGFVTGGGWINSPAGAYAPNPSLVGKANFGFVSRYQKGANVPDGQTEFQFKVANLNFRSTIYEWLVVAGARAQYKGSGTINGAGNYGFMLTAIDGEITGGGGIDKFRIKIWDKNNGDAVIYDNQMSAGIDENPTTALAGGSIVIHK